MAPEIAAFSSREPDWSIPPQTDTPSWTERWGRKALGWSVGLAAVAAIAGTAAWMYRETKVESTLAMVADHTPEVAGAPVQAAAPGAVPQFPAEEPPPLRMLPREQLPAVADAGVASSQETADTVPILDAPNPSPAAGAAAVAATAAVAASPSPDAGRRVARVPDKAEVKPAGRTAAAVPRSAPKTAAKRQPERRAATTDTRRGREPGRDRLVRERERVAARVPATVTPPAAMAPAQRPAQQAAPGGEGTLAETLRLCRAAGYHATACIKRGCEATRYGLACRG